MTRQLLMQRVFQAVPLRRSRLAYFIGPLLDLLKYTNFRPALFLFMNPDSMHNLPEHAASVPDPELALRPRPGLLELGKVFLEIGATSFGGMWAATRQLEEVLDRRKGWLNVDEQHALMLTATVVPAPKFLAFGGLVGFRLRGWAGSVVATLALLAPGALMVLAGAALLSAEVVGPAIIPLQRTVSITVAGMLLGNAWHQLRGAKAKGRQRRIGTVLALSVASATIAGMPLALSAMVGLALGMVLIRDN